MQIGETIRDARIAAGLTQRDLAIATELTEATIGNAERGAPITVTTLEKILQALGLELTVRRAK